MTIVQKKSFIHWTNLDFNPSSATEKLLSLNLLFESVDVVRIH